MKEISKVKLTEQVNSGLKVEDLAEFYEIPKSQVRVMLKQAGLKIRRTRKGSAFKLIDDTLPEAAQGSDNIASQDQPAAEMPEPTEQEVPAQTGDSAEDGTGW
jgi:hypothetical protein